MRKANGPRSRQQPLSTHRYTELVKFFQAPSSSRERRVELVGLVDDDPEELVGDVGFVDDDPEELQHAEDPAEVRIKWSSCSAVFAIVSAGFAVVLVLSVVVTLAIIRADQGEEHWAGPHVGGGDPDIPVVDGGPALGDTGFLSPTPPPPSTAATTGDEEDSPPTQDEQHPRARGEEAPHSRPGDPHPGFPRWTSASDELVQRGNPTTLDEDAGILPASTGGGSTWRHLSTLDAARTSSPSTTADVVGGKQTGTLSSWKWDKNFSYVQKDKEFYWLKVILGLKNLSSAVRRAFVENVVRRAFEENSTTILQGVPSLGRWRKAKANIRLSVIGIGCGASPLPECQWLSSDPRPREFSAPSFLLIHDLACHLNFDRLVGGGERFFTVGTGSGADSDPGTSKVGLHFMKGHVLDVEDYERFSELHSWGELSSWGDQLSFLSDLDLSPVHGGAYFADDARTRVIIPFLAKHPSLPVLTRGSPSTSETNTQITPGADFKIALVLAGLPPLSKELRLPAATPRIRKHVVVESS